MPRIVEISLADTMPTGFSRQHTQVLMLKLAQVNEYISKYEEAITGFERQGDEAKILHGSDPAQVIVAIRDGLISILKTGPAQSLIKADLEKIRKSGTSPSVKGPEAAFSDCLRLIGILARKSFESPADDSFAGVAALHSQLLTALQTALRPAHILRNRLQAELNRREAGQKKPTEFQADKRERDRRLRELHDQHPTAQPAELLKIAKADGEMTEIVGRGIINLTPNVIKHAMPTWRKGKKLR